MHLIAKQTFRFKRKQGEDVVLTPSRLPQQVPDNIADDPIFNLAIQDGSLTKIEIMSPAPAPPAPAATEGGSTGKKGKAAAQEPPAPPAPSAN